MASKISLILMLILKNFKDLVERLTFGGREPDVPPFNPDLYRWERPTSTSARSPCPALNTLANHGYLPHDGMNISRKTMIRALQQGYHLSYICAWFITTGGYFLTGQFNHMSLFDLSRHNGIEHNASLVHADAAVGQEYAPIPIDWELFDAMCASTADKGRTLTAPDIARIRVQREKESQTDDLHAEIARGEIGLVLDLFGGGPSKRTVDLEMLRKWWSEERFPEGWEPRRTQTLVDTMLCSQTIKAHMKAVRAGTPNEPKDTLLLKVLRTVVFLFEKD
jgi:hypothetical protein